MRRALEADPEGRNRPLTGLADRRSFLLRDVVRQGRVLMAIRTLAAAASLLLFASPAVAATPGIGEQVTDTTFTTAYGQSLSMGELRGQVVVITYWMSDCGVCDDQLTTLDYYYRQRRNVGLRVLVVSAEDMTDRQLRAAFKGKLIHPIASIRGPFEPSRSFPTIYVIDRNGQVRHILTKTVNIDQLNQILVPLLKQPQP